MIMLSMIPGPGFSGQAVSCPDLIRVPAMTLGYRHSRVKQNDGLPGRSPAMTEASVGFNFSL